MPRPAVTAAAAALLLMGSSTVSPQVSVAIFSGRYRLTLTFGPACTAQVRTVSLPLTLSEAAASDATEVSGTGSSIDPQRGTSLESIQLLLLHQRSALHGPYSTYGGFDDRWAVRTNEGYLVAPWLMLDGTVTAGSGRPQARGTGAGVLQVGRTSDDSSLGYCSANNHTWALDPQ